MAQLRKKLLATGLTLLIVLAAHLPARAEFIILKGAELKPYREVVEGFKESCNCEAREKKLPEGKGLEPSFLKPSDTVLVVGTTAFKKIKTVGDIRAIYTMVPSEPDLSSTGMNMSGVSMDISPELYISAMQELFPKVKKIALLHNPDYNPSYVKEAAKAASLAGVELVARQVRDASKLSETLSGLPEKTDLLWMLPDPTIVRSETVDLLLRFSFERGVPVFSFSRKYVEMGAVASLDIDPFEIGVQAGEIASQLSAGRQRPVRVYARKPKLWFNKKVAAKMGITVREEALNKGNVID